LNRHSHEQNPRLTNGNGVPKIEPIRMTVFAKPVLMSSQMHRCPTCIGIGTLHPSTVCPTCGGRGTIDEKLQVERRKRPRWSLPGKTIITISRDKVLQMTRTELLHRAGYSVIALTTDAEVMKFLELEGRPSINLILLCHSVPEASRISLCKALKKSIANAPILMLENAYDPTSAEIDGRLENIQSPEAMLDMVQLLISSPIHL